MNKEAGHGMRLIRGSSIAKVHVSWKKGSLQSSGMSCTSGSRASGKKDLSSRHRDGEGSQKFFFRPFGSEFSRKNIREAPSTGSVTAMLVKCLWKFFLYNIVIQTIWQTFSHVHLRKQFKNYWYFSEPH